MTVRTASTPSVSSSSSCRTSRLLLRPAEGTRQHGEPALWLSLVQTLLALAVGLGLTLSGAQVGLINGAAAAVLALVAAVAVRPFPVPLLMGATSALLDLGVGFGLPLTAAQVGLANGAIAALVGFILRMHVSPAEVRARV